MAWIRCTGNTGGSLKVRTASGAIASFETNLAEPLQSLKCEINAKQDLHGENKPYPAGGGVNIWDEEWELGSYDVSNGIKYNRNDAIRPKNLIPVLPNTQYYKHVGSSTVYWNIFYDEDKNFISASGNMNEVFTTPLNAYYMVFTCEPNYGTTYKNDISINNPATDTSYHPYENVCPIEGFTEANITRCGVNLWDEQWELGSYTASGEPTPSTTIIRTKNFVPIIPSVEYCFRFNVTGVVFWYDANKNFISSQGGGTLTDGCYFFTAPANARYLHFRMSSNYGTTYNHDLAVLYPSSEHNYHPYTGNTYTIAFGQMVYGGVLDVTRGKLNGTKKDKLCDGSESWQGYTTSSDTITFALTNAVSDILNQNDQISNMFTYNANAWDASRNLPNTFVLGTSKTLFVQVRKSDYPDLNSFKTFLSNNNLNVVYNCTPFDIDLTPYQIEALLSINNVWHDGNGDTEVKYLEVVRN